LQAFTNDIIIFSGLYEVKFEDGLTRTYIASQVTSQMQKKFVKPRTAEQQNKGNKKGREKMSLIKTAGMVVEGDEHSYQQSLEESGRECTNGRSTMNNADCSNKPDDGTKDDKTFSGDLNNEGHQLVCRTAESNELDSGTDANEQDCERTDDTDIDGAEQAAAETYDGTRRTAIKTVLVDICMDMNTQRCTDSDITVSSQLEKKQKLYCFSK
jgi:hypothetical protein